MAKANGEDTTPARVFDPAQFRKRRALDAKLRERIEGAVEKLIEALDDAEDTDTDTQADDEPIDDDETEPSLGSLDGQTSQEKWSAGKLPNAWDTDCEGDEHDGREPDVDDEEDDPGEPNGDDEPSLGWTISGTVNTTGFFVVDGEQGVSLSVAELDALRAKRRPKTAEKAEWLDGEAQFVLVTRRGPGGAIRSTRLLTPEEQARHVAELRRSVS